MNNDLKKERKNILRLNLPVKVAKSSDNTYFASIIQDIREEYFAIMLPYHEGRPLILISGDEVLIRFVQEKESYLFVTTVLSRQKESNLFLYLLKLPEKIEQVQNRLYVRLPVIMKVWRADLPAGKQDPAFLKTKTLDLSAGGMKIVFDRFYQKEDLVLLKFSLPSPAKNDSINLIEFNTRARVVRCETVISNKLYHAGIEFLDLKENQRDKIFNFIFREMSKRKI